MSGGKGELDVGLGGINASKSAYLYRMRRQLRTLALRRINIAIGAGEGRSGGPCGAPATASNAASANNEDDARMTANGPQLSTPTIR